MSLGSFRFIWFIPVGLAVVGFIRIRYSGPRDRCVHGLVSVCQGVVSFHSGYFGSFRLA